MPSLTKEELLAFIKGVEDGTITLTSPQEPQARYCGSVLYEASNGWTCRVFNDCNEWDYFESFTAPDGRTTDEHLESDFEGEAFARDPQTAMDRVFDRLVALIGAYRPTDEVAWKAYGIPGYMKRRDEKWSGFIP